MIASPEPAAVEPSRRRHRVLVTGATATLGRMLCHDLYHDDRVERVVAISRDECPYYFKDFDPRRFRYRQLNIQRPRQLSNLLLSDAFREARVDTVYHLAFLKRAGKPGGDQFEESVEGLSNFIDRCLEIESVRRFVFLSGSLVYRLRAGSSVFIDEEADLNFDSRADPWTKARVDADMICRSRMDNPRGVDIVVFRPGPIMGNNISSHLSDLMASYVVLRMAGYDPMIRPIHARDVIRAFKMVLDREKGVRGVFNIAGKDIAPLSEFLRLAGKLSLSLPPFLLRAANRFERAAGLTHLDLSSAPDWMRYGCLLDTRRAEQLLGFFPQHHVKFKQPLGG